MFKPEKEERFPDYAGFVSYTRYQTRIGLRVSYVIYNQFSIFIRHLFKRHKERLILGIGSPLDKVHHFYSKNRTLPPSEFERKGIKNLVGICTLGYILAEQRVVLECNRYVTFNYQPTTGPSLENLRQNLLNRLETNQPNKVCSNTALSLVQDKSLKTHLRLALQF